MIIFYHINLLCCLLSSIRFSISRISPVIFVSCLTKIAETLKLRKVEEEIFCFR